MYPTNYYIALGTNVGNYKNNFIAAIRELNKLGQISKIANICLLYTSPSPRD